MSLDKQMAAFQKSVQSQAHLSQARRVAPPGTPATASGTSTPTPTPSTPGSSQAALKRKRPAPPVAPAVALAASEPPRRGEHYLTQVHHAVQYLKQKEIPQTPDDIVRYLSLMPEQRASILQLVQSNERVSWDPVKGLLEYRPIHNIRSAETLLAFLQAQTTAQGLLVKDLKEGWTAAIDVIDSLEKDKKVLVTRTKKDNQARMVWFNDPEMEVLVDGDFKDAWHATRIPPQEEVPRALEALGLKPTAIDPSSIKAEQRAPQRKRRANNRKVKVSNTHMTDILKSAEELRKGK